MKVLAYDIVVWFCARFDFTQQRFVWNMYNNHDDLWNRLYDSSFSITPSKIWICNDFDVITSIMILIGTFDW